MGDFSVGVYPEDPTLFLPGSPFFVLSCFLVPSFSACLRCVGVFAFVHVAGMFLGLDESAFREDLSSTSIRAGAATAGL